MQNSCKKTRKERNDAGGTTNPNINQGKL